MPLAVRQCQAGGEDPPDGRECSRALLEALFGTGAEWTAFRGDATRLSASLLPWRSGATAVRLSQGGPEEDLSAESVGRSL